MFKFEAIRFKLILTVILLVLVAASVLVWKLQDRKVIKLQETVMVQKVAAVAMKDTLVHVEKAAVISEDISTVAATQADEIVVVHEKVTQQVQQKVKSIERKYKKLPSTIQNAKALNDQTSAVMIDGLWDSYCMGVPNNPACHKSA